MKISFKLFQLTDGLLRFQRSRWTVNSQTLIPWWQRNVHELHFRRSDIRQRNFSPSNNCCSLSNYQIWTITLETNWLRSDCVIYRRPENQQSDVVVILAVDVIGMNNNVRNCMIDGRWCTETRLRAVRIFAEIEFANSDWWQSVTVGFSKCTVTGSLEN